MKISVLVSPLLVFMLTGFFGHAQTSPANAVGGISGDRSAATKPSVPKCWQGRRLHVVLSSLNTENGTCFA